MLDDEESFAEYEACAWGKPADAKVGCNPPSKSTSWLEVLDGLPLGNMA